jgi:hypothetical protein
MAYHGATCPWMVPETDDRHQHPTERGSLDSRLFFVPTIIPNTSASFSRIHSISVPNFDGGQHPGLADQRMRRCRGDLDGGTKSQKAAGVPRLYFSLHCYPNPTIVPCIFQKSFRRPQLKILRPRRIQNDIGFLTRVTRALRSARPY